MSEVGRGAVVKFFGRFSLSFLRLGRLDACSLPSERGTGG